MAVVCDREDEPAGAPGPGLLLDRVPGAARQRGGLPAHAQCHHQVRPIFISIMNRRKFQQENERVLDMCCKMIYDLY